MASKFILIVKEGQVVKRDLRKPRAPRPTRLWFQLAREMTLTWKCRCCAFRIKGLWHIIDCDKRDPVRTFPANAQGAAEMYLLALENRNA